MANDELHVNTNQTATSKCLAVHSNYKKLGAICNYFN